MYVKLFGSILDSSIWAADLPTRVVWITMLAMADEYGIVNASVSGLARRAAVSEREVRKALKALSEPDRESRTKTEQGRRIEAVDGGWLLLNYAKYRELRTKKQVADAIRQARHRVTKRDKPVTHRDASVMPSDKPSVTTEAEADTEAEAKEKIPADAGDTHWVKILGNDWATQYQGTPPYGQIGKHLKPLVVVHGVEVVAPRWKAYLEANEAQYASPARFANTFGSWGTGVPGGEKLKVAKSCENHPDRDWVVEHDRRLLCRECAEVI